jgi:sirohydrochlorin cobaltochelatase
MTRSPAIVLAAFGASSPKARQVYCEIEASVRTAHPQSEIAWAYLSQHIVERQRKLGVVLPTLPETLADLQSRGVRSAIVQPLLVAPGEEYHIMKSIERSGLELFHGKALLGGDGAADEALDAIAQHVQPDVPNVLVCHGNRKYSQFNQPLVDLQSAARLRFPNLIVASIEGEPGDEPLERVRIMAAQCGEVVFIPFMMVAGEHINNDVMGEAPDSWRNLVGASRCFCRPPLGNNPAIHRIFLRRIDAVLKFAQENLAHV